MRELRADPVTGRVMILATDRQRRPRGFQIERATAIGREACPFCPGHEAMTPPEVLAFRPGGGAPDTAGWDVRVVPNKFPAVRLDEAGGDGVHEVIVETPDHDRPIAWMSGAQVARVLWAWRERIGALSRDRRLRHVLVFTNHGAAAGATLAHPHSQLIALPWVPDAVRAEIDGARRHFASTGCCVFCDIARGTLRDERRVVQENPDIVAIAPYASRFAYETWLLPTRHASRFEQASGTEIESVARLLRDILRRMHAALDAPPFNLVLHTSPSGEAVADVYHWHVEILPALTRAGGFEWGTGSFINPTPPEDAAAALRAVALET